MDGAPSGIRPEALESCARAAGLPWDEETQDRFSLVAGPWKANLDAMIEEDRDKEATEAKKAKRSKAGKAAAEMVKRMKQRSDLEN